jgi:hypothetical protein
LQGFASMRLSETGWLAGVPCGRYTGLGVFFMGYSFSMLRDFVFCVWLWTFLVAWLVKREPE